MVSTPAPARPASRRHNGLLLGLLTGLVAAVPLTSAARPLAPATGTAATGPYDNGTVLPNGRLATPAGRLYNAGDFPLGLAVSPDGRLAVAVNSGYGYGLNIGFNSYCGNGQGPGYCPYVNPADPTLKATEGSHTQPTYDNSLSVTDLRSGRVREIKAHPTTITAQSAISPTASTQATYNFFYIGAAFSPNGRHLYASGGGNNAIYDFAVRRDVVSPRPSKTVTLSDAGLQATESAASPPVFGHGNGYTAGLTVSPNGRYVLVAHEFENTLEIVDTKSYAVTRVALGAPSITGGSTPYAVAVSPDSATAYVTEQGTNTVAIVSIAGGALSGSVPVGDHPTAVAVSPDGSQVYVANADNDTLSIIATATNTVAATLTLHALPGEQLGSTPNAVAVSPDGQRVYVALAGDDAVAVVGTQAGFDSGSRGTGPRGTASPAAASLVVGGMIPTGWYPSGLAVSPDGSHVYIASAKGLGSRYLDAHGRYLTAALSNSYQYDGDNMPGIVQAVAAPTGAALLAGTAAVRQNIAFATNADATRGAASPIPAPPAGGANPSTSTSPIKYVIEVVRENRTFDQVLGDVAQDEGRPTTPTGSATEQTVDAYPGYTIFGRQTTPNAHALVGDPISATNPASYTAFATSDNFYSDGEASVQGHWWTAAANVNDYVEKAWRTYYSPRNHFYDPVSPISTPHNCTLFEDAFTKQMSNPTFTFRNYGELIGLSDLSVPSTSGIPSGNTCTSNLGFSDPNAVGNETLDQDDRPLVSEFFNDIGIDANGQPLPVTSANGNPATHFLRNFSYLILSSDHTGGLAFKNTPRSRVAQNDASLGMLVAGLSRSKYWSQTAIVVMEDDSQDGLDHRDGHRNLLYVISPYAKHAGADGKPGYVSHVHYSQVSVLKTIELILGLPYLSTYDQNAAPLYDLFQNKNDPAQLTPADLGAYNVQPAPSFVDETYAQIRKKMGTAADVLAAESRHLDLSAPDKAGPMLEIINWQVERPHQAVPAGLLAELRTWDARHGIGKDGD